MEVIAIDFNGDLPYNDVPKIGTYLVVYLNLLPSTLKRADYFPFCFAIGSYRRFVH